MSEQPRLDAGELSAELWCLLFTSGTTLYPCAAAADASAVHRQ